MYASLISAGVSQLYDLYKSVTDSSGTSGASFKPPPPDDSSGTSDSSSTGPVNSTSTSGGGLSDALHKLFTDLQSGSASTATSTDATDTVAGDLQSVFKQLKGAGEHGHHKAGPPAGSDSASTSGTKDLSSAANPFGGLAASLLSYSKSQSLGAASSTSTSLTA